MKIVLSGLVSLASGTLGGITVQGSQYGTILQQKQRHRTQIVGPSQFTAAAYRAPRTPSKGLGIPVYGYGGGQQAVSAVLSDVNAILSSLTEGQMDYLLGIMAGTVQVSADEPPWLPYSQWPELDHDFQMPRSIMNPAVKKSLLRAFLEWAGLCSIGEESLAALAARWLIPQVGAVIVGNVIELGIVGVVLAVNYPIHLAITYIQEGWQPGYSYIGPDGSIYQRPHIIPAPKVPETKADLNGVYVVGYIRISNNSRTMVSSVGARGPLNFGPARIGTYDLTPFIPQSMDGLRSGAQVWMRIGLMGLDIPAFNMGPWGRVPYVSVP